MKIRAIHDSYGFKGSYHDKGSVIEIESGEWFPEEHFEVIGVMKSQDEIETKKEVKKTSTKKH